jgi:AcrR family transcriptional regulator
MIMNARLPADERRKRIIDVAKSLFARQSFHATTTRDIARAGGVSDALLYTHFTSKQQVLEAILDEGMQQFSQAGALSSEDDTLPITEYMRTVGQRFLHTVQTQRDLFVILVSDHQAVANDERFARFIDAGAVHFGSQLQARATQGELRPDFDGYLVARQFIGAIIAYTVLQDLLGIARFHPLTPSQYLDQLIETTLHGIVATP